MDATSEVSPAARIVAFENGELELHGLLHKAEVAGPFPTVLYNHGSAPGLRNNEAFDAIAPIFVERGWVFFAPYRRGFSSGWRMQVGDLPRSDMPTSQRSIPATLADSGASAQCRK